MKQLNLHRLWEIMNLLSEYESELQEQDIFINLLGARSEYLKSSFEHFLEYYSFKIDGNEICIFNQDGIPYEDYNNTDFSYLMLHVLELSDEEILELAEKIKEEQLQQQELDKTAEKKRIESEIERLKKQLERYE